MYSGLSKCLHSSRLIALLIATFCCTMLVVTIDDYGITWDEVIYYEAGQAYSSWLLKPAFKTLESSWNINHEHPPLSKTVGGVMWQIFHKSLNVLDGLSAFRLAAVIFAFVILYALFRFSSQLYNLPIAVIVTISFFFMPRVFYHSHLGTLDIPVMTMMFLTAYSFWKSRFDKRWTYLCGITIGLGCLIKINMFFMYLPLTVYILLEEWSSSNKNGAEGKREHLPGLFSILSRQWPLIVFPPVLFFLLWPWLWLSPVNNALTYFAYHLLHFDVPVLYAGQYYTIAPWHYPFVMLCITTPIPILAAVAVGIIAFPRGRSRNVHIFLLCCFLLPMVLIAMPGVPKYDGIRLFLSSFPFIAMFSGAGLWWAYKKLKRKLFQFTLLIAYVLILIVTLMRVHLAIHPHQIIYFNCIVEGLSSKLAENYDLDYWGGSYKEALPWIKNKGDASYCVPLAEHLMNYYQENNYITKNISFVSCKDSDYMVLLARQGLFSETLKEYFFHKRPLFMIGVKGIPLVKIYKLNNGRKKGGASSP